MERKIGEIFECNGEWYQCLGQFTGCPECAFKGKSCDNIINLRGECISYYRSDRKDVHFKKLEKVGEPYAYNGIVVQKYKLETNQITIPGNLYTYFNGIENTIEIGIEQTKEDMEGKKIQHYDCFFDGKFSKSNLKPFDLKAAKAGKPVCTRDGRKARIICFDAKGDKPIIALVEMGTAETPNNYPIDGKAVSAKEASCDLMMLPEKKEGWVNVYTYDNSDTRLCSSIFNSKEDAIKSAAFRVKDTIKIEWEE